MSFAPIQLLLTSVPYVWAGFDYSDDRNMSWCLYKGAVGTLPDMAFFAKGCTLIHEAEANSYINKGETGAAPLWFTASTPSQVSTFTPAELQNMLATPLEIAAAPGVGKFLSPKLMTYVYTFVTTPYTQPGNTNVVMGPNNMFQTGTALNAGASFVRQYSALQVATLLENEAMFLTNTGAEMTLGDGTLTVIVDYDIKQFPI